jgi:flagellar hook protein FlgE
MGFDVALSGINAATSELDVVGNNVANASTVGFKSARVEFSDVYASSALGTSSVAIGTGVKLASVTQLFTQGTISASANNLDLAINGQGFFCLNASGTSVYTRAGNFQVDNKGYVVNTSNNRLTGFLADASGTITGATGDMQINTENLSPTATKELNLGVNLPATSPVPVGAWSGSAVFGSSPPNSDCYNQSTSTQLYDSLGNSHIISTYFIKSATANQWDVRVQIDGVDQDNSPAGSPFTQAFTSSGVYDPANSQPITVSWAPLDDVGMPNGATRPQVVTVSIANSTQFGSPFAVQSIEQDGFATGRLNSVDVDTSGIIFGRYTNGQSRAMGQVALADFSNPNGLQPLGNSAWGESYGSGVPLVGAPGTASLGVLQSGALEDSNVNLTESLVELIKAQRNFQANAQTIRTEDTVTQSIINIR